MVGFKGSCWQHLTDDATDADATAFLPVRRFGHLQKHSSFGMGGDWEKMDETDQMLGGTKRSHAGGRIRWCGRGYGECKVLGGKPVLLYLAGCGWRWGDFGGSFFFAAPFFVASGWVGGGFPSNLFQVSSGPLFFGQISGGSSNSRVPGGFSPRQLMGSDL